MPVSNPVRIAPVERPVMSKSVGSRLGVVPAVHDVTTTQCDIPGVSHAVAPRAGAEPWSSPSGGVGWSLTAAHTAATGEGLERYHGVPAKRVPVPAHLEELVNRRSGTVMAFDVTPAYSPHPVAIVTGWVGQRGLRRIALGAACRATWEEAVDKAFLEWCQGMLFAGVFLLREPDLCLPGPTDVRTFEHHAAYYTLHPERWDALPLLTGDSSPPPPASAASGGTPAEQLDELTQGVEDGSARLFWRDLSTVDTRQVGVRVARVLSPDLTSIHCDERWPFLGGRASDLAWRYPWAVGRSVAFPSPAPTPSDEVQRCLTSHD